MNLFQRLFNSYRDKRILKKISSIDGLGGMTVNERLCVTDLDDEFHKAMSRDHSRARQILKWLKVDDKSIEQILTTDQKSTPINE